MTRRFGGLLILALAACSPPEGASDMVGNQARIPEPTSAFAASEVATTPDRSTSRFTTNGLDKCRLIEKNEEEGGYYRHRCPGAGGFNYEHVESDLRQSLVIIAPDGRRGEVSPAQATGSGGFSTLGSTFDWRGLSGAPPRTVTVRYNVNEDPEATVPARSYLVVVRLTAPVCPIAVVPPGPGQNDEARAIADRDSLPACIAGQ